jgi:hypothetical protein
MLSLFGSLLGFGTSFLPKMLSFFEDKRDQAHELKLMEKQLEQKIKLGEQKLQFMNVDADIRETEALQKNQAQITMKSSQWIVNLSSSVRPIMTYLLFIEFMALTFMLANDWIDLTMYDRIWSSEIQAVWAAVVSFWFGQRSFNRK